MPIAWQHDHRVDEKDEKPLSAAFRALRANMEKVIEHARLTEPQFAKRAKIDQKTMWRVMHGNSEPTLDTLSKLAKAAGLDPWQLLAPELEPDNPPLLAAQSERLRVVLANIKNTKEAIEGVLREQGNTRPGDLEE